MALIDVVDSKVKELRAKEYHEQRYPLTGGNFAVTGFPGVQSNQIRAVVSVFEQIIIDQAEQIQELRKELIELRLSHQNIAGYVQQLSDGDSK